MTGKSSREGVEILMSLEDVSDISISLEGVSEGSIDERERDVDVDSVISGNRDGMGDGLGRISNNSLSTEILDIVGVLSGSGDGEGYRAGSG